MMLLELDLHNLQPCISETAQASLSSPPYEVCFVVSGSLNVCPIVQTLREI